MEEEYTTAASAGVSEPRDQLAARTDGPWQISTIDDSCGCVVESASGRMICECYEDGEPQTPEDQANARLVAAAPELYEALGQAESKLRYLAGIFNSRNFTDRYDDGPRTLAVAEMCSNALAKLK